MGTIGDFGEVLVDKVPERDICAFGEDCTGQTSTPIQRICAFGEECVEAPIVLDDIGLFGEVEKTALAPEEPIGDFGEKCVGGEKAPAQRICAFGEECPPSK